MLDTSHHLEHGMATSSPWTKSCLPLVLINTGFWGMQPCPFISLLSVARLLLSWRKFPLWQLGWAIATDCLDGKVLHFYYMMVYRKFINSWFKREKSYWSDGLGEKDKKKYGKKPTPSWGKETVANSRNTKLCKNRNDRSILLGFCSEWYLHNHKNISIDSDWSKTCNRKTKGRGGEKQDAGKA